MMTLLKLGGAIAVLVYLERRGRGACAGKSNGDACGPGRICHKGACLEKGKWTLPGVDDGGAVNDPVGWLSPETWGSIDAWFERAGDFVDGMGRASDQERDEGGPITDPNDPRLAA